MATKISQSPEIIWKRSFCDAALDYLGRNNFKIISEKIFQSLKKAHYYHIVVTKKNRQPNTKKPWPS